MVNGAIQILYDEHDHIVSIIDAAKQMSGLIGKDDARYEQSVRRMLDFFRNYADKYHHYKEEVILFPEMCRKNELLETGVILEMLENHSDFREMLRNIETFLDKKEYALANRQLLIYCEALLDHIAVENDEVFQMAESLFSKTELENISFRFSDCDHELGEKKKAEFEQMVKEVLADINLS